MIVVNSTADSGAGTLRQAVLDAAASEEITFDAAVVTAGSITLTSGEIQISQALIITGPGSALLSVFSDSGRVFNATAGVISISGLTVGQSSDTDEGGAIRNQTTLALSDIVVTTAQAANGGGVWNSSTLTINGLTIQTCSATGGDGGGLYNSGTVSGIVLNISGCTSTINGAGVFNSGTLSYDRGSISANTAASFGGGVYNTGTYSLTEVTISDNVAVGNGGGIHNSFGTITILRSALSGNNPIGIYNSLGSVTIDNSTISTNTATGVYDALGTSTITHSTITLNQFGYICEIGFLLTVENTIIAGNTVFDVDADTANVSSTGYNAYGTSTNPITAGPGDQFGLTFATALLGPLQDNGGPTYTHELLTGSPCIDAGNTVGAPATDQRGEPRVVNGTIDIGAYESEPPGGLIFTGTLPGWLSIANDCLVVTSGSFRANTPAAADAAAQAALDTFVADNLASGDLSCGAAGACASAPQFATTTQNLTIDGTTTSPNRPGKFNKLVTFSGTAGDTVNIWMDSLLYDCYLYLMDPGNIVVASDPASGYIHGPPSISSSVLHYTLLSTGTYTIDCTTYDAGKTGAFTLVISSDPIAENTFGVDNGNYLRDIVYASNANRIVCFNQIGNATADSGIYVASGCTGELLATFFMPGSAPPGFIYNALAACYNSTNGLIYVAREDGTLFTFNPLTYEFAAIASGVVNPADNGHGMVYDPVNDRLFIGVFTSGIYTDKGIRVFDCATNTEIALVDVGGSGAGWVAYADTGFIYCTVGTTVKKMDCSTLAVTSTALVCATNDRLYSVVERQLLLVNTTITGGIMPYNIVDYTTDAILDTRNGSVSGIQGAVWDPYRNRILISSYGDNTLTFGCGVAFYSPDTAVIDNFISISEATTPVYSTEANSVFVSNRSYAILYKIV